jgi:ACR3 family arsenite transporter
VQYESFPVIIRRRETYTQLVISVLANWIIGPFIMLGVAWACLPEANINHYRNGVILVGLARCIAMVLIWNQLARGDPEYCAMLVVLNSFLQVVLYAPLAIFFLVVISRQYTGAGQSFSLSFLDVFYSVLLFLGVPLLAAIVVRFGTFAVAGREWFEKRFVPFISPVSLIALIWTVFVIFAIQGQNIVTNIGDVLRVAVPMVAYFCIMFTSSLLFCYKLNFGYEKSVTQAFTASSNNFELAIAVAAATFGVNSPEALAATIGPLVEVPVLLSLVYVALFLQPLFTSKSAKTANSVI